MWRWRNLPWAAEQGWDTSSHQSGSILPDHPLHTQTGLVVMWRGWSQRSATFTSHSWGTDPAMGVSVTLEYTQVPFPTPFGIAEAFWRNGKIASVKYSTSTSRASYHLLLKRTLADVRTTGYEWSVWRAETILLKVSPHTNSQSGKADPAEALSAESACHHVTSSVLL